MNEQVAIYSKKLGRFVTGTVVKFNYHSMLVRLPDGSIIKRDRRHLAEAKPLMEKILSDHAAQVMTCTQEINPAG